MAITQITNHVAAAQARVLEQYKSSPQLLAIIGIAAQRTQVLENAFWAIFTQRSLATAVGQQLDNVGQIVGLARAQVVGGSSDDVYRLWLRAQILVNTSSGSSPDLIAICEAVCASGTTVRVVDSGPLSARVLLGSVAQTQPAAIAALLQLARAATVHLVTEFLNAPPAQTFTFDGTSAQGFDNGQFAGAL